MPHFMTTATIVIWIGFFIIYTALFLSDPGLATHTVHELERPINENFAMYSIYILHTYIF